MNLSKVRKADFVILCTVVPAIIMGLNLIFFGRRYFSDGHTFLWATLASGLVGLITWTTHTWAIIYVREKLTGLLTNQLRVLYSFGVLVFLTVLIVIGTCWIYHATHFLGFVLDTKTFLMTLSFGLVLNIAATSFNEGSFSSEKWSKAELEAEQLKRIALQRELDNLKSQVNPHFLFNSLNSLSSLISESPEQAEDYVNEMSKVYRYLLQVNHRKLVTLEEELKFIHSYYHLLKTRYGQGICLTLEIAPEAKHFLIPPMTLQLLVENAVKHNKVLKEEPLQIMVSTLEGRLEVLNNLQCKTTHVHSNGVGLKNISEKYRLLGLPGIAVEEKEHQFRVSVPLVTQETIEES